MMLRRFLLVLVLLLAATATQAQRVLLRASPATDSMEVHYGPNRAFFRHLFLGYAPVVGQPAGPGADLRYGKSAELFLGLRHKFRVSRAVALGFDTRFARLAYHLAQTPGKQLPTPALHYSESLVVSQLQLEPYLRLGFGRRGNVVGHYLDLSGWGGWVTGAAHHYEDRLGNGGPRRVVVAERGLPYVRRWTYGVGARLGSSRYAATAHYRCSRTFTTGTSYTELPRWVVGLELGIF